MDSLIPFGKFAPSIIAFLLMFLCRLISYNVTLTNIRLRFTDQVVYSANDVRRFFSDPPRISFKRALLASYAGVCQCPISHYCTSSFGSLRLTTYGGNIASELLLCYCICFLIVKSRFGRSDRVSAGLNRYWHR